MTFFGLDPLHEATTTTMPRTTESSIQLGMVGYKFRKQFTAGWFTGTVVQILPLVHNTTFTTTTNDTTKKEDGGLEEGGGGDKKHDIIIDDVFIQMVIVKI